jgi:hypothetical protein
MTGILAGFLCPEITKYGLVIRPQLEGVQARIFFDLKNN